MKETFVLSAEGPDHCNKTNWTTHVILGVFDTCKEALEFNEKRGSSEEEIIIWTAMVDSKHVGFPQRLNCGFSEVKDEQNG